MWTRPSCNWELENLNCEMFAVSYLVQFAHSADFLPGDLHVRQVHYHPEATAKAYREQKGNLLVYHMNSEGATFALNRNWEIGGFDEFRRATDACGR